jgi:UDP-N-acetylglucosamine 2-epimerase (non-hydrolysing)
MKVLSVFGTRPEAIKLAPVLKEMESRASEGIESITCITAQHREMLDQVMGVFGIVPDYDLKIMTANQTPSKVASAVLDKLEPVIQEVKPDWVVVQGDTTTVTAASIAAFYNRAPVAHVEAGLRTFDRWQPFPEEINRRIAGVTADLHFAPTSRSRDNLLREGISEKIVLVTGNPVIDAAQQVAALPAPAGLSAITDLAKGKRIVLITAHRRENLGEPLEHICDALNHLAAKYEDSVHIVYPVHLNPNVQKTVRAMLGSTPNITLTEPLDYFALIHLMKRCHLILTDSGGIQEEGPSFGAPVLVLREVTERPEAVDAGTVRIVGTDTERIISEASRLLDSQQAHDEMARAVNPYGDGHASERIVTALLGKPVEQFSPRV